MIRIPARSNLAFHPRFVLLPMALWALILLIAVPAWAQPVKEEGETPEPTPGPKAAGKSGNPTIGQFTPLASNRWYVRQRWDWELGQGACWGSIAEAPVIVVLEPRTLPDEKGQTRLAAVDQTASVLCQLLQVTGWDAKQELPTQTKLIAQVELKADDLPKKNLRLEGRTPQFQLLVLLAFRATPRTSPKGKLFADLEIFCLGAQMFSDLPSPWVLKYPQPNPVASDQWVKKEPVMLPWFAPDGQRIGRIKYQKDQLIYQTGRTAEQWKKSTEPQIPVGDLKSTPAAPGAGDVTDLLPPELRAPGNTGSRNRPRPPVPNQEQLFPEIPWRGQG